MLARPRVQVSPSIVSFKSSRLKLSSSVDIRNFGRYQNTNAKPPAANQPKPNMSTPPSSIEVADFFKLDLRVAKIIKAESVEGADKLLRLTLDVGNGVEKTVLSGIKTAYQPQDLVGKQTIYLANLAPRKMKFGTSEGMILAASDPEGKQIFLTGVADGAQPGMKVS